MARTCLVLLLLVSTAFLAFGDDVIIDCGSSDVYVDDNLVVWMGDESFMGNIGQSQVVQTRIGMSQAMSTLRAFTSGKKNCYTIKSTTGQRVLARASFYYGNYDKKSSPPTFDLLFDGNSWATIQTSLDQVIVTEVSYVVKSAVTNICLAQSKANQFPFISALEVRDLPPKMYNLLDSSYALVTKERVAYGATTPIRFSDDVYDRIWSPAGVGSGLIIVKNDAIPVLVDVSGISDKPPQAVFAAAVTTSSTAFSLTLSSSFPAGEFRVYVNLYLTEVRQLTSTQKRSFNVYLNDKPLYATPITLSYQSATELSFSGTASSTTTIMLEPTLSSTLPPVVSAAEVFYVIGPLNEGTDSNDVGSPGSGGGGGGGGGVSGSGDGGGGGGSSGSGGGGGGGGKRKSKTPIVLGTTIPALFVLSGIAAALYVRTRRRGAIAMAGGGGGAGGGVNEPNDIPQAEPRENPVVVGAMVNDMMVNIGNVNPANAIG